MAAPRTINRRYRTWVVTRYERGATIREIAAAYGLPASAVYRLLLESGVELRPRGRRPKQ